ncbi:hypothetical protein [Moritella sp. F3]|uniref:hypothetical protein n=1 Tax=Moritella sp. F3 TaxID=2718882 RepID=UPI0018E0CE9D|nr:hypothetical protein [Moritella sp. F3]GIC75482.1 hypothetical protein FMO001_02090 [Moritella sp. F1]GIC80627.1 hypothetical protein FMO003_09080 [Moritella sp. F3]
MFKVSTLASIPLLIVAPTLMAEPFGHNNAQLSYRAEHWALNVERAITEDFYITGFYHHTDDIALSSDVKAKAKILGAGLMTSTNIGHMTEFYAGANLAQSSIRSWENGVKREDETNFYPSVIAGIKLSSSPEFEADFNVNHGFSDSQYTYGYLDSTSFTLGGKYFIDQAMALGLSYVWVKEQDKAISWDNIGVSFSLYFE